MRTETVEIFSLKELSEAAKNKAYEKWRSHDQYHWASENDDTRKAFEAEFPVKIRDWSYGDGSRPWVSTDFRDGSFDYPEAMEEMSGQRLATYIWNNYQRALYKGKYYHKYCRTHKDGTPINSEDKQYGQGIPGQRSLTRYSKIMLETGNCPLTGYGADEAILEPIYKFLAKPDSTTFPELMQACADAWVKYCDDDYTYSYSMEAFEESAEANDYEYYANGTQY